MKKAILITSAVFLVSAILTVAFAVGLGASGIRSLFDGTAEGYINDFIDKVEQLDGRFEDLGDKIDNRLDHDFDSAYDLAYSKSTEVDLSGDTVTLGFDAAEIRVVPATDSKLIVDMNVYSKFQTDKELFGILINTDGYDYYLKKLDNIDRSAAKVTVAVPESVKEIKIKASAGEISVQNFSLSKLDIELDAGEVDIENVQAENGRVKVNAGEIGFDKFCKINDLEAVVDIGEISYDLSASQNVIINYSVNLGTADIEHGSSDYVAFDANGNETSSLGRIGRLENINADENAAKVQLKVGTGSIEFDEIY